MSIANIILTAVVVGIAIFAVYYFIKKRKTESVEETVNVDDKTYTIEKMEQFIKKD